MTSGAKRSIASPCSLMLVPGKLMLKSVQPESLVLPKVGGNLFGTPAQ